MPPLNPHFTGRDSFLSVLRDLFFESHPRSRHVVTIFGPPGIGKTQLAAHYAHRHKSSYRHIFWLRSDCASHLRDDYAALGAQVGVHQAGTEEHFNDAIQGWLAANTEWLLIFDDAKEPGQLTTYLPSIAEGHVLVTSINPNWLSLGDTLNTPELSPIDATTLILRRTGTRDRVAAENLVTDLTGMPLALLQASSYIESTGITIQTYLRLFHADGLSLLNTAAPEDYGITLTTKYTQLFDTLSPAARDLLTLTAFLAPANLPFDPETTEPDNDDLMWGAKTFPRSLSLSHTATNRQALNDTVAELRRASLVVGSDGEYSIHPLIQYVVRGQLSPSLAEQWTETTVNFVDAIFPEPRIKEQ
jgi:hypothetical protein